MHFEEFHHWGENLGQEMYLNRYGHSGIPVVVFPSSGGSHTEFADFKMIESVEEYIYRGVVQFFTLSSYDKESWLHQGKSAHQKALAHQAYERYIIDEAIPFIKHVSNWHGSLMVTGCSMGAFHAVNFFLKHPDVFQKVIALSGIYDARFFTGNHGNDPLVHENSPVDSLWLQEDSWFIDQFRNAQVIVCTGLGAYEEQGLPSFYKLKEAFEAKALPAWFDTWGEEVNHDWEWWRKQLPYYLGHVL